VGAAASLAVGGGATRWRAPPWPRAMGGDGGAALEVEEDVSTTDPMEVGRRVVRMMKTNMREEEGEAYRGGHTFALSHDRLRDRVAHFA
jgi:hypothetical protein